MKSGTIAKKILKDLLMDKNEDNPSLNITSIVHKIVRNSIDSVSEMDSELTELKTKYEKLLNFVNHIRKQSCCNICSCLSCDALDVLRSINEDDGLK